ncbi:MAG: beta-propeller domain-containing protein [Myxococcales bacterium]|nr:beta-propeller domain-containing protein [Myxococcales bacterium]
MRLRQALGPVLRALPLLCLVLGASAASGCRSGPGSRFVVEHAARKTMTAFGSDAELETFLRELAAAQERERRRSASDSPGMSEAAGPPAPPEPTAAPAQTAAGGEESVTNTQHAGVDEGGIVKVHGGHLVVLRRGRLFTVAIGDGSLEPVSAVDAYGPGIDPGGTWYDEMLLGANTVVVVGYSYARGGTELGLFDIDDAGRLAYRATYHLRSNDYYSSRNYASRLIGDTLVFYTPLYLALDDDDPWKSLPALRKWHEGATDAEWRRTATSTRVYRPIMASSSLALHTVTACDLGKPELACESTVVMGPAGRVFYVSPGSVYVWVTDWATEGEQSVQRSLVYRMPLDGSAPSVLRVLGAPVDQFSFLEADGALHVVVQSEGSGEAMWSSEATQGSIALLRVPLESFSDGGDAAPREAYHPLPKPEGYTLQNRFVGAHLLYGTGSSWGDAQAHGGAVFAYRFATGGAATRLPLPHGVDRIEALGTDAIVIGTAGKDLHFSPVALGAGAGAGGGDDPGGRSEPRLAARYTRKDASQGELRSHGFFYKPESADAGLLGLPIRQAGRPGYEHLFTESASILFLRNQALALSELGTLAAEPPRDPAAADDGCKASCVDWYGNARPLFLRGRVFALLGYELVEGEVAEGRIREVRRVTFAPKAPRIAR